MTIASESDIHVGDFSKTPYGRYVEDGKYSGSAFRRTLLAPAFKDPNIQRVNVYLDGVQDGYEYSSAFLEEAFGGLVRECGVSVEEVRRKLNIVTIHHDYVLEINEFLDCA